MEYTFKYFMNQKETKESKAAGEFQVLRIQRGQSRATATDFMPFTFSRNNINVLGPHC